jgi:hypothetical protein
MITPNTTHSPVRSLSAREILMSIRPQELINDWYARIDIHQKAHSVSEARLKRTHHVIGWAALLLSMIAAGALLSGTQNLLFRSVAGSMGLLAAALAGVQTFLSLASRSERHRAASTQLAQLRREIAALEQLPSNYLKNQTEVLLHIGERLMKIEQITPVLGRDLIRQSVQKVSDPQNGQNFYICLDDKINLKELKALNLKKDDLFICRESALDEETAADLSTECRLKTI